MKKQKNYYDGLAADYSFPVAVDKKRADKIIKAALTYKQAQQLPPPPASEAERKRIQRENRDWWPSHCEALRRGRGDILSAEYRDELVYFCQDGPFYGKQASIDVEKSWWKLISHPGVIMTWPIVMFHDEVVYFEWACFSRTTGEVTGKGNAVFLRRGHFGGIYVKVEQLTFFRNCHEKFFSQIQG